MNLERLVIELTGRRYARRRDGIWAVCWRVAALVVALVGIWAVLCMAFTLE